MAQDNQYRMIIGHIKDNGSMEKSKVSENMKNRKSQKFKVKINKKKIIFMKVAGQKT